MTTYSTFPGQVPGTLASGLKFANEQVLITETQAGGSTGQFMVMTSPTTLGFVTVSPSTYTDGLNTSTFGTPVVTNSSTPLIGQYLRAKFSTGNAIWDYAYMNGISVFNDTLTDSTGVSTDVDSVAIGAATAVQGVAIGRTATVTTRGVAIGKNASATAAVTVGFQATSNQGVTIGNQSSSDIGGVTCGTNSTTTSGVAVGGSASSTFGVAVGNSCVAVTGISIGTSVTSQSGSIGIGNSITASGSLSFIAGNNCANSNVGGRSVVIGFDCVSTTNANASWNDCVNIGSSNTVNLTGTSVSTRMLILGTQNVFVVNSGANLTKGVYVGHGNSVTANSNPTSGNIVLGNDNIVGGGVANSVTIGSTLTNGKDNGLLMGCSGQPFLFCTNVGAFMTHRTSTSSAATTVTAVGCLGRLWVSTLAGAANLTLPSGTALDSEANITSNLWVGMSFEWKLVHNSTGTLTILSGAGNTYLGPTVGASTSLSMVSIRTGVNTWLTYGS